MKRAAVSVISNIAEGAGSGSKKQNARFLAIARGSHHELLAHVLILSDLKMIEADAAIIGRVNSHVTLCRKDADQTYPVPEVALDTVISQPSPTKSD